MKIKANHTFLGARDWVIHPAQQGVLLFSLGVLFESLMDTVAKLVSTGYPLPQILLFRCLCGLVPLLMFVAFRNSYCVSTLFCNSRLQVLRAVLFGFTFCIYVYSLKYLSMITALALFLTLPFFMLLVSRVFHNEKISSRSIYATLGGFAGAILIIQPDFSEYGLIMLMPVLAAISTALVLSVTKRLSDEIDSVSININSTVILFVICLLLALIAWETVQPGDMVPLILVGIFGGVALLSVTAALVVSQMSLLAPFQYFSVVWAAIFGWVVWADAPTLIACTGIALIVISGLSTMVKANP